MRIENIHRDVANTIPAPVFKATIEANAKTFRMLSSDIYSNVKRAIIREYAANCADAHTEAGTTARFTVALPTVFSPDIQFIDHGLGMSFEFMTTRFLALGDGSTKDDNEDVIGGFGLGCKVGFAYTDQWNVTTTHNGEKCAFALFIDEGGIPSIQLLDRRPTDEPSGTIVSIPVDPDDIQAFHNEARDVLRHFSPMPIVTGLSGEPITPPPYLATGDGWGLRHDEGDINIIMGGVLYPLSLSWDDRDTAPAVHDLEKIGLDLTVPIGTFLPSASRESLRINPTGLAFLDAMAKRILPELPQAFEGRYEHLGSLWEARVALKRDLEAVGYHRRPFYTKAASWHGHDVNVNFKPGPGLPDSWYIKASTRRFNSTYSVTAAKFAGSAMDAIEPHNTYLIFIHQESDGRYVHRRFVQHFETLVPPRNQTMIVYRDVTDVDALLNALGNPPASMVEYYSNFDPLPPRAKPTPRAKRAHPLQGLQGFYYSSLIALPSDLQNVVNDGRYHIHDLTQGDYCYVQMDLGRIPLGLNRKLAEGWVPVDSVMLVSAAVAKRMKAPTLDEAIAKAKAAFTKKHGDKAVAMLGTLIANRSEPLARIALDARANKLRPTTKFLQSTEGRIFKAYQTNAAMLNDSRVTALGQRDPSFNIPEAKTPLLHYLRETQPYRLTDIVIETINILMKASK